MKPQTEIKKITPSIAKEYLSNNPRNRRIRQSVVERYARLMSKGDWKLSLEPIIFDEDGYLMNGQHRLLACIKSNTSFETLIARGADPESFINMDTGTPRRASDVLGIDGYPYSTKLPSTVRVAYEIEQAEEAGSYPRTTWMSHSEIVEFVEENQELLIEACAMAVGTHEAKAFLRPSSAFAGLYFHLASQNAQRAKEFFHSLISGENLTQNSPIYKLRSLLITESTKVRTQKRSKQWKIAIAIKAWNAWLNGKTIKILAYKEDDTFPAARVRKKNKSIIPKSQPIRRRRKAS